jgi:hypothetical protein
MIEAAGHACISHESASSHVGFAKEETRSRSNIQEPTCVDLIEIIGGMHVMQMLTPYM